MSDLLTNLAQENGLSAQTKMEEREVFAQISLDSIEVYMRMSSQKFGLSSAITTIKCYTKAPSREETTLIGTNYGLHNTNKLYGDRAYYNQTTDPDKSKVITMASISLTRWY